MLFETPKLIQFELLGTTIYRKKNVKIAPQDGSPVSFLIRPTTLGNIDIRLTAKTNLAGDAVVRKLLVKVVLFIKCRN